MIASARRLLHTTWSRARPALRVETLAPEDVWPDALRMTAAAIGAYALCQALGLRGGFFAVLTALMTTRPSGAAGSRALIDRLVGMGAGILTGLALVWLERYHVPAEALIALAMLPLCYLVARFRKYQAAPITAILVLSAGLMVRLALRSAAIRVAEVCIGGAIGFLASILVFRRTSDRRSRQHAADMLRGCGALAAGAVQGKRGFRDMGLRARIRTDLRLVSVTSRLMPGTGGRLDRGRIQGLVRLNYDLLFLNRALGELRLAWRARAKPVLERLADSFRDLCDGAADCILDGGAPPDFGAFDAALRALEALPETRGMPQGDAASAALPYLMLKLRADLHEVLTGYAGKIGSEAIDVALGSMDDAEPGIGILTG